MLIFNIVVFSITLEIASLDTVNCINSVSSIPVPSVSPQGFTIVEDSITSTNGTFMWESVDENDPLINGFFKGYKVKKQEIIIVSTIVTQYFIAAQQSFHLYIK